MNKQEKEELDKEAEELIRETKKWFLIE